MIDKEDLKNNLEMVQKWIGLVDQKVSIFLAFQGVVLTLLLPKMFLWIVKNLFNFDNKELILLVSGFVLIIFSLYKSILTILPKLSKSKKTKSITYFKDIADFKFEDFKKILGGINLTEYRNELIEQIYLSSKIATRKHYQFRDSVFIFFIGLFLLMLNYILFYI